MFGLHNPVNLSNSSVQLISIDWVLRPLPLPSPAPTGKVFPLGEFAAAVAESQQVGRLGKVLLKLH